MHDLLPVSISMSKSFREELRRVAAIMDLKVSVYMKQVLFGKIPPTMHVPRTVNGSERESVYLTFEEHQWVMNNASYHMNGNRSAYIREKLLGGVKEDKWTTRLGKKLIDSPSMQ